MFKGKKVTIVNKSIFEIRPSLAIRNMVDLEQLNRLELLPGKPTIPPQAVFNNL